MCIFFGEMSIQILQLNNKKKFFLNEQRIWIDISPKKIHIANKHDKMLNIYSRKYKWKTTMIPLHTH